MIPKGIVIPDNWWDSLATINTQSAPKESRSRGRDRGEIFTAKTDAFLEFLLFQPQKGVAFGPGTGAIGGLGAVGTGLQVATVGIASLDILAPLFYSEEEIQEARFKKRASEQL